VKKITKAELYNYVTEEVREILQERCPDEGNYLPDRPASRGGGRARQHIKRNTNLFLKMKNQIIEELKDIRARLSVMDCNRSICNKVTFLIKDIENSCKYTGSEKGE